MKPFLGLENGKKVQISEVRLRRNCIEYFTGKFYFTSKDKKALSCPFARLGMVGLHNVLVEKLNHLI